MFAKSKIIESIKNVVNFWCIIRFLLVLICFGWFYSFAIQIINKYNDFKTMVTVEYRQPNVTQLPAVTLCSYSFITDQDLFPKYPNEWSKLLKNPTPYQQYALKEKIRAQALADKTVANIFNDSSITPESVMSTCYFYRSDRINESEKTPCNQITSPVESIFRGRKCFTFFSHLNITGKNYPVIYMEFEMVPFIEINLPLNQGSTHIGDFFANESIIYCIHSPNIIPTLLDAPCFRTNFADRLLYDTRFQKQVSHLKPPPYKTQCRWYYEDNPPGERSRGDCLNRCIQRWTYNKCFNYYSVVTRDMLTDKDQKICSSEQSSLTKVASAKTRCMDECKLTCIEEVIEIPYASYTNVSHKRQSEESYIKIKSSTMLYAFVYHKEAIESQDYIGMLGAHAHIWLGLSAIKIFHWVIHFINYVRTFIAK